MAWGEGLCPGCHHRHDSDDFILDLCVYCTVDLPESQLDDMLKLGVLSNSDKSFIADILVTRREEYLKKRAIKIKRGQLEPK